jgi:hypothetical protein
MIKIDLTEVTIKQLITHHVGNKLREEDIKLSIGLSIIDEETKQLLLKYFLQPLKSEEYFQFTHPVELGMNEIFSISGNILKDYSQFINGSEGIAKLLYASSMHPKIKAGELNVAYFQNIKVDGASINALGIFKSETNVPYIRMSNTDKVFEINHDYGFEIKGIDKGCLILDMDEETGYKVLIVDAANKGSDAQYWKDDFLNVKIFSDEYQQTKEILRITKSFVTEKLTENFEISMVDQIELLQKSVEYFKSHEVFERDSFEEEVFSNEAVKNSFRSYDNNYREDNALETYKDFEISTQAVKAQAKSLKSVVKLDKNFDIYIKSNKGVMEPGIDENGRKFYKIFYQNEQ